MKEVKEAKVTEAMNGSYRVKTECSGDKTVLDLIIELILAEEKILIHN